MFVLSGFCCTVPLIEIGGAKKVDMLFDERGMIPILMIATVTIIATSFHLLIKGIRYSSLLHINY